VAERDPATDGTPEAGRPREEMGRVAGTLTAEHGGRGAYEARERAAEPWREAERDWLSPRQGRGMRM
jgi:hypothetical protein